jgi:hypothetical protein
MNLIFRDGRAISEFPYQTSTELSYAVMNAKTKKEKLELIKKDLEIYKNLNSDYWYKEIEDMLNNDWKIDII